MGFSKATYSGDVAITVTHPMHDGDEYVFHLTKRPSKDAREAGEAYFATKDEDAAREALTRAVAAMMSREPEGFEDFPRDERVLAVRAAEYFNDPDEPELINIVKAAWDFYWQASAPRAYVRKAVA